MTKSDFLAEMDLLIEEVGTGVFATVDGDGTPHMRWMTPVLLKEKGDALYAVTPKSFEKAAHLRENTAAEWMFQSAGMDRVVKTRGNVTLVDDSDLLAEVIEAAGARLNTLWRLKGDRKDLLVLETNLEEGVFFRPGKGIVNKVKL